MALAQVNSLNNTTPVSGGSVSSNGLGTDAGSLKNEFLTMMVSEIKNQDPLNPLDGSQYVGQLAQLSTVSSLENLRVLQQQTATQLDTLQVLQSTQLVGKKVLVPVETLKLAQTESISGQVNMSGPADSVTLNVYDANGQRVAERKWNGTTDSALPFDIADLPAGQYTFEVNSTRDGATKTQTASISRSVESVNLPGTGDIELSVSGIGNISLYKVTQFSNG